MVKTDCRAVSGRESIKAWTAAFAYQYERFRRRFPDTPLLVVFDIDGTILDLRNGGTPAYGHHDGINSFAEPGLEAIHSSPGRRHRANTRCPVSLAAVPRFQQYYAQYARESEGTLISQVPRPGVLNFMRWLQLQPAAHIALNTARLEAHRQETTDVLNVLGRAFGVRFHSPLIQMRASRETTVQAAKIAGLNRFLRDGFKVIAVADSEQENIAAIQKSTGFWDETLYLESARGAPGK